jgi:predicted KAP-like P-loop ATPase
MNLGLIFSIAAIFGSLYLLGLIAYRLFLSLKVFNQNQSILQSKLDLLAQPIEREFFPATHDGDKPINQVLAKREQIKRQRRLKAEDRRRRLVQHLQSIDLDKR